MQKKPKPRRSAAQAVMLGLHSQSLPESSRRAFIPTSPLVMLTMRLLLNHFYNFAQGIIAPSLRNSQFAYRAVLFSAVKGESNWLDLGCGHQLFSRSVIPTAEEDAIALASRVRLLAGIDYDLRSLREHRLLRFKVRGDIQSLPFKDRSFSLITANMVLEHVRDPVILLAEVHRVLSLDGIFLFHTPNLLNCSTLISRLLPNSIKPRLVSLLQNRKEEDVFPTFYRANTPKRVRALALGAGFTVSDLRAVESSGEGAMLGPLVVPELILIRLARLNALRSVRSNLIVVLRKEERSVLSARLKTERR